MKGPGPRAARWKFQPPSAKRHTAPVPSVSRPIHRSVTSSGRSRVRGGGTPCAKAAAAASSQTLAQMNRSP